MAGTNQNAKKAQAKEISVYLTEKEIQSALLAFDMCSLAHIASRDKTGDLAAVNSLILKLRSALGYIT